MKWAMAGMIRFMIMAAALYCASGCRPVEVLNGLVPGNTYTRIPNIAYGEGQRQTLDIYLPAKNEAIPEEGRDVIIFIYGGSWQFGDKNDYTFVGESFASRGFVTVVPDYRIYPEVVFPDFLDDTARAIAWTFQHIQEEGGNPGRVFLIGHSAGAYNAVMTALLPGFLEKYGVNPRQIKGVIGLAGPYDFLPLENDELKKIFYVVEDRKLTQPITYAGNENVPPMLLITGDADWTVDPSNSSRMVSALVAGGNAATLQVISGMGHYRIASALSTPLENKELMQSILQFIRAH